MLGPRHLIVIMSCVAALSANAMSLAQRSPMSKGPAEAGLYEKRTQSFDQPEPGGRSPRNASYDIDVTLDHDTRSLRGRETIRWRNISARPADELHFHLYWNAWRAPSTGLGAGTGSTWLRESQLA